MLKKIALQILGLTRINRIINKLNDVDNANKCYENSTCSDNAVFLRQARVDNLTGDPKNIIISGSGTKIRGELGTFKFGGKITIGSNCYIGELTKIRSGESISIGNNVLISHNVNINDCTAHEIDYIQRAKSYADMIKNGHPDEKGDLLTAPIVIEDDVWINFNVIILRGVTIGKGAILAAGCVITKDIPPFVLVGGNPARIIRQLEH